MMRIMTPFTFDYKEKTYSGTFEVRAKMVHVSTEFGRKSTHLGSTPPEALAKMMGREMVQAADTK
jgi:hypothetical protein